ncbi:MAG: HTTM domain-containing protein [Cytophagales bacterium]
MSIISKPISIFPLVVFRIIFGLCMLISTVRFIALGWIDEQYIKPVFHFSYFGFEWLPYPSTVGIYLLFLLLFTSSIAIILGFLYRISTILFFLSFTYIELLDKTYYLNHYYFVSLIGLLLIFLPANRFYSLDVKFRFTKPALMIEWWTINIIKFQIGLVYFYAGLAKLNSDWLLHAMPLKIWLPAHSDMPILGWFFNFEWVAYAFSWAGMLFDTIVPFLLLNKKIRALVYVSILIFHSLTGYLFQIGMFPLIMSACVLVFFSNEFHYTILKNLTSYWHLLRSKWKSINHKNANTNIDDNIFSNNNTVILKSKKLVNNQLSTCLLTIYVVFQLVFPWRYLLYPGNLFWTEEGYRFSWRVMLMEKAGTAQFYVKDNQTGRIGDVNNTEFLNRHQEKQMAMQPDMILQFAHFLKKYYENKGINSAKITAEIHVTLNGRPSKLLIDPKIDLANKKESFLPKKWILPLNDEKF